MPHVAPLGDVMRRGLILAALFWLWSLPGSAAMNAAAPGGKATETPQVQTPTVPAPAPGTAPAGDPAVWEPLIKRLTADGLDGKKVRALFSRPEAAFSVEPMGDKLSTLYMKKYGLNLVRDVQNELMRLGYFPGPADGRLGRMAKWSVKAYKESSGAPVNAKVDRELLSALRADSRHAPAGFQFPVFTDEQVYELVMRPERLAEGEAFYKANRAALAKVRAAYGVPEDVAVGLLTVETRAGNFLGDQSALLNLAGMALAKDYDHVAGVFAYEKPGPAETAWLRSKAAEKGDWAYKELKALLAYAERIGRDPLAIPGSIYGAIGIAQFMPTNAVRYALDGNGDGKADLFVTADALESMGNFLRVIGWRENMSEAEVRKTLRRYNQSDVYVNTILAVAEHLRKTVGAGGTN